MGLLQSINCWTGIHSYKVMDWHSFSGYLQCARCEKVQPMTGRVLVEWIRYRTARPDRITRFQPTECMEDAP